MYNTILPQQLYKIYKGIVLCGIWFYMNVFEALHRIEHQTKNWWHMYMSALGDPQVGLADLRIESAIRIFCGFADFFLFAWKTFCTRFQASRSSTYITYQQFFVNAQAKINNFDCYLKKLLTKIFNRNVFQIGFFKLGSHPVPLLSPKPDKWFEVEYSSIEQPIFT